MPFGFTQNSLMQRTIDAATRLRLEDRFHAAR